MFQDEDIDLSCLVGDFTVMQGIAYPCVKVEQADSTPYQIDKWRTSQKLSAKERKEAMESEAMKLHEGELYDFSRVPIQSEHFKDIVLGEVTSCWLGDNNELCFTSIIRDPGARRCIAIKDCSKRPKLSIKYSKVFHPQTRKVVSFKIQEVTLTSNPRFPECKITLVASDDGEYGDCDSETDSRLRYDHIRTSKQVLDIIRLAW